MSDSETTGTKRKERKKISAEQVAEAKAAILEHLQVVGGKHWRDVFERFPDIPESTMWRWQRDIKAANKPPAALAQARHRIRSATEGVEIARATEAIDGGVEHIARHIPAAPSPAYLASSGQQGMANIDFLVQFHRLLEDAELLRKYSMNAARDGNPESIRNPIAFDRSIQRRLSILEQYVRVSAQIYDLRMMADFYDAIIGEIRAESPDVAKRIMQRLGELNARRGMTIAMQV